MHKRRSTRLCKDDMQVRNLLDHEAGAGARIVRLGRVYANTSVLCAKQREITHRRRLGLDCRGRRERVDLHLVGGVHAERGVEVEQGGVIGAVGPGIHKVDNVKVEFRAERHVRRSTGHMVLRDMVLGLGACLGAQALHVKGHVKVGHVGRCAARLGGACGGVVVSGHGGRRQLLVHAVEAFGGTAGAPGRPLVAAAFSADAGVAALLARGCGSGSVNLGHGVCVGGDAGGCEGVHGCGGSAGNRREATVIIKKPLTPCVCHSWKVVISAGVAELVRS